MEAPEKIYLYPDDRAGYEYEAEWSDKPWGEDCVEYTRTDAFIEKATEWLEENLAKETSVIGNGNVTIKFRGAIEAFKKAMEE